MVNLQQVNVFSENLFKSIITDYLLCQAIPIGTLWGDL